MRRAAKVDGNHRTIVAAFKALGCTVQSLAAVGKGVPDLLVAFAGLNHLVEIKDGSKRKSQRQFTKSQVVWASMWRAPRHLVESVEDVQRLVGVWREMAGPIVVKETPAMRRGLAALLGAIPMPSDVEVDASDYERPEVVEPTKLRKAGL
jgi:hypothetical protein